MRPPKTARRVWAARPAEAPRIPLSTNAGPRNQTRPCNGLMGPRGRMREGHPLQKQIGAREPAEHRRPRDSFAAAQAGTVDRLIFVDIGRSIIPPRGLFSTQHAAVGHSAFLPILAMRERIVKTISPDDQRARVCPQKRKPRRGPGLSLLSSWVLEEEG